MFLKKLYIFFWKLEDRHDGKLKKILDVSKNKKRWQRNLFCDFFQWKRARKDTNEACTTCSSVSFLFWYYLRGSRRRDDRSMRIFFRLDFFLLFVARFFFPSVSDRVSKSKFLFPFSFSSHERLPWFKHVWDAPESPLSRGATFKVGDGLTVDRHCFLFCL